MHLICRVGHYIATTKALKDPAVRPGLQVLLRLFTSPRNAAVRCSPICRVFVCLSQSPSSTISSSSAPCQICVVDNNSVCSIYLQAKRRCGHSKLLRVNKKESLSLKSTHAMTKFGTSKRGGCSLSLLAVATCWLGC